MVIDCDGAAQDRFCVRFYGDNSGERSYRGVAVYSYDSYDPTTARTARSRHSQRAPPCSLGSPSPTTAAARSGAGTMMDSFLSILPKGLFGMNAVGEMNDGEASLASSFICVVEEQIGQKRARDTDTLSGSRTPTLISTSSRRLSVSLHDDDGDEPRPIKRFRGERNVVPISPLAQKKKESVRSQQSPLSKLPEDVVAHCLSFLGSVEDRFSLQCTSKQFKKISDSPEMRSKIQVGGDRSTGLHGIIQEHDTPETASQNLVPFAEAGNLEAIYM